MAAADMVFLSVSPTTKARAYGDTIVVDKGTLGGTQQPADPGTPPGGTSGNEARGEAKVTLHVELGQPARPGVMKSRPGDGPHLGRPTARLDRR